MSELDEQSGVTSSGSQTGAGRRPGGFGDVGASKGSREPCSPGHNDTGGASRFFPVFRYAPKSSSSERDLGLSRVNGRRANTHTTVKGLELMRWLVRLVTPHGGLVLDPFCGSGTTGMACSLEGFDFLGIEQNAEYAQIAEQRIAQAQRLAGVTKEAIDTGEAPAGPVQVKLW